MSDCFICGHPATTIKKVPNRNKGTGEHGRNVCEQCKQEEWKPYVVMATQGGGGVPVHDCDTLDEALKYVTDHEGEASFGIKYPNGSWHKWEDT